ncbi:MAG: carboxypeptidase-like regulatory domain-containing protein [Balneolaceae bacterium]
MRHLLIPLVLLFFSSNSAFSQVKVSGYVIEMSTGEPIKNATVFVHNEVNIAFNPPIQTTTNQDGYYEFTDFKEGEKYSVNAFVYYEVLGDTMAYIYQPGVLTIPKINTSVFKNGVEYNFAFSEFEFKHRYFSRKAALSGNLPTMNPQTAIALRFLKPKIETNFYHYFMKTETSFFEKKTW